MTLKHREYAHGISDAELIKEALEFCNEELDGYEGMEYDDDSEVCCQRSNTFIRELVRRLEAVNPSAGTNLEGVDIPLLNALVLQNALEMTGCDDEADLIDMANVGNSLMERIDSLVSMPGPYHRWSPADDPAEIVFDLVNDLDELREENAKLRSALEWYADQVMAYSITQANEPRSAVHGDRGARARAALAAPASEGSDRG